MNALNTIRFTSQVLGSVAITLLLICATNPIVAQTNERVRFPYQALVLTEDAKVHSGPGQLHYATESLSQGSPVEVHRHDPGGWCAIRPVEGSFSLVPQATLDIVEQGVGEILENGTQAWVGTKLGAVNKPLWQVKLQKGETVEVLGQVSWPSPEGHSNIWYQIAPPAGEFRWIKLSDIQLPTDVVRVPIPAQKDISRVRSLDEVIEQSTPGLTAPLTSNWTQVSNTSPATDQVARQASKTADYESSDERNQIRQVNLQTEQSIEVQPDALQKNRGWRQATRAITNAPMGGFNASLEAFDGNKKSDSTEEFLRGSNFDAGSLASSNQPAKTDPNIGSRQTDSQQSFSRQQAGRRFASADVSAPNLARELDAFRNSPGLNLASSNPARVSRNLTELESYLTSEMVKQNPAEWQLDDLEQSANGMFRSGNAADQARVQRFLDKIENCKRIRAGYASTALESSPQRNSQRFSLGARQNQPVGSGVSTDVNLDTTYDAHGWLTELVRNGGNSQSNYALQDATGKITHHVAAVPGMNLQRYLKKRVGIIGQRGYHKQLQLNHVTAQRIIGLDSPTIRR